MNLQSIDLPCPGCGLGFVQRDVVCIRCHTTLAAHILSNATRLTLKCPVTVTINCPLCLGKRHWKRKASIKECAWRQWASEAGYLVDPANPQDMGPPSTARHESEFAAWMQAHPTLLAGSTPAELLIRQAARAALQPTVRYLRPQGKPRAK